MTRRSLTILFLTSALVLLLAGAVTMSVRSYLVRGKQSVARMEIAKIAVSQGMKTLRLVALEKVREGLTTLEQTLVVTSNH